MPKNPYTKTNASKKTLTWFITHPLKGEATTFLLRIDSAPQTIGAV
jgi:hypothetical protein